MYTQYSNSNTAATAASQVTYPACWYYCQISPHSLIAACRTQPQLRSLRLSMAISDGDTASMLGSLLSSCLHSLITHISLLDSPRYHPSAPFSTAEHAQNDAVMQQLARFTHVRHIACHDARMEAAHIDTMLTLRQRQRLDTHTVESLTLRLSDVPASCMRVMTRDVEDAYDWVERCLIPLDATSNSNTATETVTSADTQD